MKKTHLYSALAFILGSAICVTFAILPSQPACDKPGVTRANFDRIKTGMTRTEVERIFGEEAKPVSLSGAILPGNDLGFWFNYDESEYACITFDVTGPNWVALEKSWTDRRDGLVDKILRWLRNS